MSLTRQFLRDMRPFFRMFDEAFRTPAYGLPYMRSVFDDPFFRNTTSLRPTVDVTENENNYIIEAELPGVKKDHVQVRIGDGGRSLTIEGKIVQRSGLEEGRAALAANETATTTDAVQANEGTSAVANAPSNQISSERTFVGSSTFTRTVWLPKQADPQNVSAKLSDGILTVTVPKANDPGSVEVQVQ